MWYDQNSNICFSNKSFFFMTKLREQEIYSGKRSLNCALLYYPTSFTIIVHLYYNVYLRTFNSCDMYVYFFFFFLCIYLCVNLSIFASPLVLSKNTPLSMLNITYLLLIIICMMK